MNIEFRTQVTPERACVLEEKEGRDSHVIREAAWLSP